ncbi:hypothetical protein [Oceanimonas doudoroffii]|uniref:hypothetical protein n=1 Tax=Oceanimonas doudoroffii TaxID=84158 RepID=UPI0011401A03|nr:hypothetical protein [Oceanimonas doudoroffii]
MAEVNIRKMKRVIYRMITQMGSEKYVDKLPEIECAHNHRIHPKTGFRPIDINEENTPLVFRKLYPGPIEETLHHHHSPWNIATTGSGKQRLPFRVGDRVVVRKNFQQFHHGYLPAWQPNVYRVSKV